MPESPFEGFMPERLKEADLSNLPIDAYLFEDYTDLDEDMELILGLAEAGRKDLAKGFLIKDFRVVFLKGALAQLRNPNLLDELNQPPSQ